MNVDCAAFPVMDDDDIVCMDCGQPIPVGAPFSQRPDSAGPDGMTWVDVVCAFGYCRRPR